MQHIALYVSYSILLIFVHNDVPYISYWRCYIKSAILYDVEGPIFIGDAVSNMCPI